MKSFLKSIALGGMAFWGLSADRAVVLMYHSLEESDRWFMNVRPANFERQMAYIAKKGFPVISLAELARRIREKLPLGGSIVITFDDGYRDNYTTALPALRRYGFPATIFVATDRIGTTDARGLQYVSAEEIQELEAGGLITIQPHTMSHPRLAEVPLEEARAEVTGSKLALESLLGSRRGLFAYPYGSYNAATADMVRGVGFDAAVTVDEGTVKAGDDAFKIARVSIDASTTHAQFRGKLSRAIDIYTAVKGGRV
jgi:peptidoglycan/xylan/chitin deacetylase (PgdA/CDA1 family)